MGVLDSSRLAMEVAIFGHPHETPRTLSYSNTTVILIHYDGGKKKYDGSKTIRLGL